MFYKEVKKENQRYSQMFFFKHKDGNLIGEEQKIKARWREYSCKVLNEGTRKRYREMWKRTRLRSNKGRIIRNHKVTKK